MTNEEEDAIHREMFVNAEIVFKKKFEDAIAAGHKVLVAEDGALVEVSLEGRRKIKDIEPPVTHTQRRFKLCKD